MADSTFLRCGEDHTDEGYAVLNLVKHFGWSTFGVYHGQGTFAAVQAKVLQTLAAEERFGVTRVGVNGIAARILTSKLVAPNIRYSHSPEKLDAYIKDVKESLTVLFHSGVTTGLSLNHLPSLTPNSQLLQWHSMGPEVSTIMYSEPLRI
jgi:hypothetical protein